MDKVYERTENGVTTHISIREAMAEVNGAMMGPRKNIREMSSVTGHHHIVYRDGRSVRLVLVDAPTAINQPPAEDECTCGCRQVKTTARGSKGRRIVTANGKRYVVGPITPARPRVAGAVSWIPEAYLTYWSERNGEAFGATRHACASRRPGTIGRAIWDAVNR